MALESILRAIVTENERRLEEAAHAHESRMADMRQKSDRESAQEIARIREQHERKKGALLRRAHSQAAMTRRLQILKKRQEWMEKIYADALAGLAELPQERVKDVLTGCLKKISEKGTIHPSKKHEELLRTLAPKDQFTMGSPLQAAGGFTCVTEHKVYNFTFDFLVREILRPQTELEMAASLF